MLLAAGRGNAVFRQCKIARLEVFLEPGLGILDGTGEIQSGTAFEATPILVDGLLYVCSPFNRVFALDPHQPVAADQLPDLCVDRTLPPYFLALLVKFTVSRRLLQLLRGRRRLGRDLWTFLRLRFPGLLSLLLPLYFERHRKKRSAAEKVVIQ